MAQTDERSIVKRVYGWPAGRWLISRLIGWSAPYSGTIRVDVLELRDGYSLLRMPDRRKVRNHLNSIHACALATLTETTVGLSVLYSLPSTARGIATSMTVDYHAKARGPITGECEWQLPNLSETTEQGLKVVMRNEAGETVATGSVRFRIGPAGKR